MRQKKRPADPAYDLGRFAGAITAASQDDCPYALQWQSSERAAWLRGFSDGRVALAAYHLRAGGEPSPSDLTLSPPERS